MKSSHAWTVFALFAVILAFSQWFFLEVAFGAQERLGLRRLQKTVTQLVERACLTQDDLLVQQIMKALSGAPGLVYAALLDDHQVVLAHTDPSKLGVRLNPSVGKRNQVRTVSTVSLSNTPLTLGQLLIVYSNRQCRQWMRREALLLSGMVVFLGVFARWQFRRFSRNLQGREKRIRDLEETITDLQCRVEDTQRQAQQTDLTWQRYLSCAMNRIPEPLLLLDNRQRLVAWSPATQKRQTDALHLVQGCSWHELPLLAEAGTAIEKSLQSPGQIVEASSRDHGQMQLMTFNFDDEAGVGTWVTF